MAPSKSKSQIKIPRAGVSPGIDNTMLSRLRYYHPPTTTPLPHIHILVPLSDAYPFFSLFYHYTLSGEYPRLPPKLRCPHAVD